jgi:hypothetical protein
MNGVHNMMLFKKTKLSFMGLFLFLFCINSTPIFSQLTIVKNRDLLFGEFYAPLSGTGSVTVPNTSATGQRTTSNIILSGTGGQSAQFTISATGGGKARNITNITVSVNTQPILGSNSLSLVPSAPSETSFTLTNNSTRVIYVGGTLTVGTITSNPSGVYTGQITINVTWNQN